MAGTRCVPAEPSDCGGAVRWPGGELAYAIDPQTAALDGAIARAFDAWRAADCGGGHRPAIMVSRAAVAAVAVAHVEIADVLSAHGDLAVTTLSLRGDAIVNGRVAFHAGSLAIERERLPAVALHEVGHLLGLAHSNRSDAVMTGELADDPRARSALTADDVAAICAAYPPVAPADPRRTDGAAPAILAVLAGAVALIATQLRRARSTRSRR